ncbi:MAG: hypothetical protein K6G49_00420 [Candidatus Saccharibacteria bacterium]|nr:hypothetical protein [Candidatus Saccharibacteria bacterium]
MSFKKLAGLVVCLVLTSVMLVACGGQQESSNQAQNSSTASTAVSSGSAASEAVPGGTKKQEVRIAGAEDYKIFSGNPETGINLVIGGKIGVPSGEKIYVGSDDVVAEYGYYDDEGHLGYKMKHLYYPISGLSVLDGYSRLIGTYGDIPVVELNRQADRILARDGSNGNLVAYRCELAGCTVAFVDDENAIWNQNDLIPVGDLKNARFVDANGQSRANPLDWTLGEEVVVECGGQSYPMHADSYVYSVSDKKTEITGGKVDIKNGNRLDTYYGYDISKLEPGLYYFEGLGVYKVV